MAILAKLQSVRFLQGTLVSLAALITTPAVAKAVPSWNGTYLYEAQDGYDGGGTPTTGNPIILDLTLTIGPKDACEIEADGFQTDESIICKIVQLNPSTIDITFAAFAPDSGQSNAFFSNIFSPNTPLFTLSRTSSSALTTTWQAIQPDTAKTASGIFFSVTKQSQKNP